MQANTKRVKSEKILEQIQLADKYFSERKFKNALEILEPLLQIVDNSYRYDKSEIFRKIGNSYYYLKDFDNAIWAYEQTLKFFENNASIFNILGFMYFYRDSSKSIEYYLKGMNLQPDLKNFVMLTQVMIKSMDYSQKDLKTVFEKYVNIFRPKILNENTPFHYNKKDFDKNKKLKIGYLSSDFYCHAMMSFVLPILENHDKENFDIVLYMSKDKSDSVTDRIKALGYEFKDCHNLNNEELAQTIHNDKVDILVDLSGYTHNAIWSLLYKPAPIIVQYLGFLGTYGMREVDYIIADKFTIPEKTAKYYTEKPMYINCGMNKFTFNTKKQKLLEITPLPCLENGYITFGSFNSISKINPYTVKIWSELLKAVPTSKLLIYRTQMQERDIERFKKQFLANGIEENRLIFDNKPTEQNHFNSYLKCDIALDPMPFNGLTITIEQAIMGVPTLTLPKDTIAARGAARVNKAIGLDEFIADNENDYINKAVGLSSDIEMLKYYRKNLREIVLKSSLCNDFRNYVKEIENSYRKAWVNFCQ